MAELSVAVASRAGVDIAGVAAGASGDKFDNTGKEFLIVENGSESPVTVTLDVKATVGGLAITDPTVSVPAGGVRMVGPFEPRLFNDTDGHVNVTYSAHTDVTVKAVRAPHA